MTKSIAHHLLNVQSWWISVTIIRPVFTNAFASIGRKTAKCPCWLLFVHLPQLIALKDSRKVGSGSEHIIFRIASGDELEQFKVLLGHASDLTTECYLGVKSLGRRIAN